MKTNEKKDLQTKTIAELQKLVQETEKTLVDLKLSLEQNKLKDTRSIFNTRKKLAILKTVVTMKAKEPAAKVEQSEGGKKNG